MPRQPAMRVSNARDFLEFFGSAYPELHRHLKQTLPRDVLARMENGVRTDWIPVESDGQYVGAVLEYLGADGMRTACRQFVVEQLIQSGMMRGLFDGVVRVFGVSVGSFLRVLPSAFKQSYKDAFSLQIDRGERQALVVLDDIAPEVLRFAAYPVLWEGLFLGIYDLAHTDPRLDFKLLRGARRVEALFRW